MSLVLMTHHFQRPSITRVLCQVLTPARITDIRKCPDAASDNQLLQFSHAHFLYFVILEVENYSLITSLVHITPITRYCLQ